MRSGSKLVADEPSRPPADLDAVRGLHQRGAQLANEGRPRAAGAVLESALAALAGAPDGHDAALLAARVLNTLASVDFQLDGVDAAAARLGEAERVVEEHEVASARTAVWVQRGNLLLRVGRVEDAVRAYDRGEQSWADAPDADRCSLLLNRAVAHLDASVWAARADLRRCLREARAAGLGRIELKATHNLGHVEFLTGNLPRALELMDAAAAMDPDVAPGIARLGKAQVLIEAGLLREADATLLLAARTFRRERVARDLAETELERARCALALGELTQAHRLAAAARARFARQGADALRRSAELVQLQVRASRGRPAPRAAHEAERLSDELRQDGFRLPARAAGLVAADLHLLGTDVEAAARLLAGLGPPRRDDPVTGRMHTHLVTARLEAARDAPAAASRRVRRALDELARYQASFGSIDLRTAAAVHGRRLAELDIDLALHTGRPGAVFAAAERARAVSSRLPAIRPPADVQTGQLLAELRQLIESLRAAEQDRSEVARLLRRRRELERAIVARSWTRTAGGSALRCIPLADTRRRLAERAATMVMYVQAGAETWAVLVGARLGLHRLGPTAAVVEQVRRVRADLDVLAQPRLPGGIRAAVRSSLDRSLRALDETLVPPALRGGGERLVLVSTGVLSHLPWASLPSLAGRPLVVAPSATKWFASAEYPPAGGTFVLAALAGPDLARSRDEAAAVARAWSTAPPPVASATTGALTEAMGRATVLHVAAHGVHQPENPLFSFVRLADGPLFAHELDQSSGAPEHVVLSACEVGLATIRPGDEALGLASVLLQLGTRSVVAGVARVGDEVAEATMVAYHRHLAAGDDSSVALAAALSEVDADVTPPFVNFGAAWRAGDLEPASPVA